MARHATEAGKAPSGIAKIWMRQYLLAQKDSRQGNGFTTLYEDLRQFWSWFAREEGTTSPMTGIARPQTVVTDVPVRTSEQLKVILAACSASTYDALRDRAIILVLLQSGIRRAELAALDWGDFDSREGTLLIRHGKGDKPRVAVIGEAAGVEPGAFERRILAWLAGREPETCAVIAGLIGRAAAGAK